MTMAMDDRHTGADHKAGSFKDKLNARKGQPVDETAAAPPAAVPAETPAELPTETEATAAPVSGKIIEDGGFMIFKNVAETDTEAAAEPTAEITPDNTPDITAYTAAAEPVEPAPEAQAAPATEPDADSLEASLAKAIDALEPAAPGEAASSEMDDNLDAAIDAIIAPPAETDDAAAAAAAFNPGSFGAIGESPITADDFTADAAPEDIAPDFAPDITPDITEDITLGDHGEDITAASTMLPAADDTDDQAMMIGTTMAHAIKSIVHDEMAQSIDRIAREAVRDALRQA